MVKTKRGDKSDIGLIGEAPRRILPKDTQSLIFKESRMLDLLSIRKPMLEVKKKYGPEKFMGK